MKEKIRGMFRGPTIGKRLIFFIVVAVLLPMALILVLFYGQFYTIIQNSLLDSQAVTSQQAAKFINDTVATLSSVCNTIAEDERLSELILARQNGGESAAGQAETHAAARDTLRAVIDSHMKSNALSGIRIYADVPENPHLNADNALFHSISQIRNTYWYGIFASQDIDALFAPEYYLSAREQDECGNLAVIQKRQIQTLRGVLTVFVAVYTYDDILVNPIQDIELDSVKGISSFILNSRETVVAQTDAGVYGTYAMSYTEIAQSIPAEGVFIQKEVVGTDVFITYRDIDFTDWRMTWIVPHASVMAQSRSVILQFVSAYILITVGVMVFGVFMSNRIVGRIRSLQRQMRLIKAERPKPLALSPGKDEVGELIETYNYMVGRINTLLNDTISAAEELNNVKIAALRAQIDPHFLYNTLDMIKWLINSNDNDKASDAIIALSRFYRLTLNRGNLSAPVSAELEHVTLYVKLMNMRFDDKIEYLVDMPDDMLDIEIPLIIFQPIVENAIQHGIFEKPSKHGKILITGWSDEEMLYFLISDDGIGMTAQQISKLLVTKEETGKGAGIGIYNTHRRLQLMYNRGDCGLQYFSEYGKGTDVTFRIPRVISQKGLGGGL